MSIHRGVFPPPDMGEPEDHGDFCVWWYGVQRTRQEPRVVKWAWTMRHPGYTIKVWMVSSAVSNFGSRDDAIEAARRHLETVES